METFDYRKYTWIAGALALLGIAFASLAMGISNFDSLKHPNGQVASITVTGDGEVTALPDIATITATVREVAKTVPEAQKLVETKITKGLGLVDDIGVKKEDVKTISYMVNPKYESDQKVYCYSTGCPVPKQIIVGYEVTETIQIKVRKVDSAGEVLGALGSANITEIGGPEFTVDDLDKVNQEAKTKAVENARKKAANTAKSLGVSLGNIISYNEDNGGYYPVMYGSGASMKAETDRVTVPAGENVIKAKVTITYSLD